MMAPRTLPRIWLPVILLCFGVLLLVALILFVTQMRIKTGAAPQRERRLVYGLVLAAVLSLAAYLGGCGGGGGGVVNHNPGTPQGTSTIAITGTSNGVSHTQYLTLTVN